MAQFKGENREAKTKPSKKRFPHIQPCSGFKKLKEVDPKQTDMVLAIPDTGCNRTCHSEQWRKKTVGAKRNSHPMCVVSPDL